MPAASCTHPLGRLRCWHSAGLEKRLSLSRYFFEQAFGARIELLSLMASATSPNLGKFQGVSNIDPDRTPHAFQASPQEISAFPPYQLRSARRLCHDIRTLPLKILSTQS